MMQLALGGRDMHWSTGAGRGRRWEKGKKGDREKNEGKWEKEKGGKQEKRKMGKRWVWGKGEGKLQKYESPSFEISEL